MFKRWRLWSAIMTTISFIVIGGMAYFGREVPEEFKVESTVNFSEIDTSHPDYEKLWWERAWRFNFLPSIKYSERALKFCEGSHPVTIGERPLYCADGRKTTFED